VFKLNPVGYVVEGYRDALFGQAWIWQHAATTLGFWLLTLALGWLAVHVHRRLRPHFADVL
jgi:teichoic acid transport system permease protein